MSDDWVSAAEALRLVRTTTSSYMAPRAICTRAHVGMVHARAERLVVGEKIVDNANVPKEFWWAGGEAALEQNWGTGDFETWINHKTHVRAFGVRFLKSDIEKMVGPTVVEKSPSTDAATKQGGRPPAAWWDDLWIEICRQLWDGDLKPERQADIEAAMLNWATANGHETGVSTVRPRARKLWTALNKKDEN